MHDDLPSQIIKGAQLAGNEYAWDLAFFPNALASAEALGYACIGGQFQFRIDAGTCEMYWLNADSSDRMKNEPWLAYCRRSCFEVKRGFEKLASETNFVDQALQWIPIREAISQGVDPLQKLVFVAYFINEAEWSKDNQ